MSKNKKKLGSAHALGLKSVLFALVLGHCVTVGQTLQDKAEKAAAADTATTLGGVALGATEANPFGLVMLLGKLPLLAKVKKLPPDEQAEWHATYGAIWGGAAANNACVIGAILTGGTIGPLCPFVGTAWGLKKWKESAMERELWAICREERAYWNNPDMPCDFFKKPEN